MSIKDIDKAVKYTLDNSNEDDVIISAGSLYLIGEVRTLLKERELIIQR